MSELRQRRGSDDAIDAAAAAWFARRDAGLSPAEQAGFERWLAADSRHAEVWREFDRSLQRIDDLRELVAARGMVEDLARRRSSRRWRLLAGGATGLAAAAAVALLFMRPEAPGTGDPAGTVGITQPERRTLPDGSVVELNHGAAIKVEFAAARRGVRLLRGEAYFEVARDAARPFVVDAGGVEVRAVGTAFTVQRAPKAVNVVVTHGRIAVETAVRAGSAPAAPVFADAGYRVVASPAEPPTVVPLAPGDLERRLAWRGPRIELSGTPLGRAVLFFNRESPVALALADRDLAEMRMSGVFRADDAEGFARMLETNYGVRAKRAGNTITLSSPR